MTTEPPPGIAALTFGPDASVGLVEVAPGAGVFKREIYATPEFNVAEIRITGRYPADETMDAINRISIMSVLVKGGDVWIWIGFEVRRLEAGQSVLIPAGVPYHWKPVDNSATIHATSFPPWKMGQHGTVYRPQV